MVEASDVPSKPSSAGQRESTVLTGRSAPASRVLDLVSSKRTWRWGILKLVRMFESQTS